MPQTRVAATLDGRIGLVELRNPPHNFVDGPLLDGVADALEETAAGCRAIVLAAEGRSFCAGANFTTGGDAPAGGFRELVARIYANAERIFSVPVPVVAAVHGPAVGAGVGLALACDLRVTCPQAHFGANFVRLGIHPGFGITVTLPELVGPGAAADLLLTGRRVGGEEAVRMGLADRCVPASEVRASALALATEIAEAAPLAVTATRATLRRGLVERVREAMERELEEQTRLIATADAAEGIAAMLGKRKPEFEGR